jgi:hypothetical protein
VRHIAPLVPIPAPTPPPVAAPAPVEQLPEVVIGRLVDGDTGVCIVVDAAGSVECEGLAP